ncbi:MAG: ATP-binding protein [Alphaproteobacteria bacterium]|nr:ATP-binding protein [Alphaproteobacteria bacterium]
MTIAVETPQTGPAVFRLRRAMAPLPWLLAGAVMLPLLVAGAGAWLAWRGTWDSARSELSHAADSAAEYMRRVLDGHRAAADRVNDLLRGLSDEEVRAQEAALHARLRAIVPELPQVSTAYVSDQAGMLLLSASMAPVPRISIADREFHLLLAGPNPPATVVSRVYLGRAEDNMFFAVARPRRDTGNTSNNAFHGQVNVSVDPRLVSNGLGRLLVGPQDSLAAIRSDGFVLARHPSFHQPLPQLPADGALAQALRSADRGVVMARSRVDNTPRLIAFGAVEGWPGILVGAGRDRAAILAAWRQEALFHLLIALPAMLALAGLALLVWRGQRRLAEANALLERRVAERAEVLRASEARFRAFQELSPVGFVIHRAVRNSQGQVADFEVEYANPAAHRAVAAPASSLPGVRLLAQVPEARTDDRLFPRYCRILSGAEPGGEVDLELRNTRFNGWFRNAVVRLDAERLAISVQDMTAEHAARETLARSHAELEALVEARTAALLRAADETRRAEESARQHEKLAALGQLVGGVAHDFNNLLQVIGSGAALLRRPAITEARRAAVLEGMERAGETARELTGRLLAFARQQPLVPETFSLNARLVGMSALLRQTLGGAVQVETELAPDLWQVHADPGQMELAVLNLAVNARDAMPKGGRLLLRTRNTTLPATEGRQAGDYVCLDVVDVGIGMPPAVLSRALEPFFTTKEAGRGTGLGLPQVFGFTRQSGGDLRLESTPGQGTTVTIKLPRAAEDHGTGDATAIGSLRTPKGKSVLVVEDNEAAGEFAASLLEELGYQARTATTAVQALEMLREGTTVDAVFSDVVLPGGMSGNELAQALRARFPQVAVVLATGYGGQAAAVAPPPTVETLGKPYQLVELAAALERALARVEPEQLVKA